ncbi:hypothetical protein UFOVP1305_50 [uncultured Caudovirales phage]|uniref:Uncharacterized protein n=1 Tax=uncultured Caudovirales phage TaxID=2100421 RepID=A0A6J5PE34_9CAUD|nr:hypothetical protein UFOVP896_88 [uncultured Caudovirales phage]CAB4198086.1 hypothetical protein UFOVP1305_50 [uncultured Caudovirales phage]
MSTIATTDFTAADGAAWPTLSNGAAWTYQTEGNAFAVAPSRTVLSNQGKTLATANNTAGNRSWERALITNTATDPFVSVLIAANLNIGNALPNSAGIFLRKLSTNQYYYVYCYSTSDKAGTYYGIAIAKESPVSTFTTLAASTSSTLSYLQGTNATGGFMLQAKIVPSGSGIIISARTWYGNDPTSPPIKWVNSGVNLDAGATVGMSLGVTDASPIAGNLNGLFVARAGGGGATTAIFDQYAYYDQAPLVIQDWSGIPSAETFYSLRSGSQGIQQAMLKIGGLATAEAFGGVRRLDLLASSIGGVISGEQFGSFTRIDQSQAIGSISTGEQFGGLLLSSVFGVGSILSGEQVAGIKNLIDLATQSLLPGSILSAEQVAGVKDFINLGTQALNKVGGIATAEAFGSFTIYVRGGSVIAAHTLTGVAVASAPTLVGLVSTLESIVGSAVTVLNLSGEVSTIESLTGAVASTHLLSP